MQAGGHSKGRGTQKLPTAKCKNIGDQTNEEELNCNECSNCSRRKRKRESSLNSERKNKRIPEVEKTTGTQTVEGEVALSVLGGKKKGKEYGPSAER